MTGTTTKGGTRFKNLIPKVFYDRMEQGLDLFVGTLGFEVLYRDESLCVVGRDGAKAYVVESPEYAAKDRPELSIDTDDIDAVYAEIAARAPHRLHPNNRTVTRKPWGSREFAVLDETTVCVVFREWPKED